MDIKTDIFYKVGQNPISETSASWLNNNTESCTVNSLLLEGNTPMESINTENLNQKMEDIQKLILSQNYIPYESEEYLTEDTVNNVSNFKQLFLKQSGGYKNSLPVNYSELSQPTYLTSYSSESSNSKKYVLTSD